MVDENKAVVKVKHKGGRPKKKKLETYDIKDFCDMVKVDNEMLEGPITVPATPAGNRNFAYLSGHAMRLMIAQLAGKFLPAVSVMSKR